MKIHNLEKKLEEVGDDIVVLDDLETIPVKTTDTTASTLNLQSNEYGLETIPFVDVPGTTPFYYFYFN